MTDEEALAILTADSRMNWIGTKDGHPWWCLDESTEPSAWEVQLDGWFTVEELQAVLHFAPKVLPSPTPVCIIAKPYTTEPLLSFFSMREDIIPGTGHVLTCRWDGNRRDLFDEPIGPEVLIDGTRRKVSSVEWQSSMTFDAGIHKGDIFAVVVKR